MTRFSESSYRRDPRPPGHTHHSARRKEACCCALCSPRASPWACGGDGLARNKTAINYSPSQWEVVHSPPPPRPIILPSPESVASMRMSRQSTMAVAVVAKTPPPPPLSIFLRRAQSRYCWAPMPFFFLVLLDNGVSKAKGRERKKGIMAASANHT